MLRSMRHKSSLVRAILVVVSASLFMLMTGCEDEQQPETWVKRLDDPVRQSAAIKRLLQFYEDAMTNDKKNREGPQVKPLLDKIVEPLTKTFTSSEITGNQKGDLIAFLADTRDPRAKPAVVKALKEYKMDDRRVEHYDTRMVDVVQSIGEMARTNKIDPEISNALFEIFISMRASTLKANNKGFYRLVNNTLVRISDKSWESRLLPLLEKEIESTKNKFRKDVMNAVFWQITAAEILGVLKSEKAVEPLIKIVLSPMKAPVQTTAINALIKIGKPAIDGGVKLLKGEWKELMEYSEKEYIRSKKDQGAQINKAAEKEAKTMYLNTAVIIVANIGRSECVDPMLQALEGDDKVTKAIIARELYKLPKSARTLEAFKKIYDETDIKTQIPPGEYAKEQLAESAGSFFEKELTAHLIENALEMKGEKDDIAAVRQTVLGVVSKAATKDQWELVQKLSDTQDKVKGDDKKYFLLDAAKKEKKEEGPFSSQEVIDKIVSLELKNGSVREIEKDDKDPKKDDKDKLKDHVPLQDVFGAALERAAYNNALDQAKKVLDKCGEDVSCYLKVMASPEASKTETQMMGIKSAYMVGLLGKEDVKAKLVEVLPSVRNLAVRFVMGLIIDRLSPNGDADTAKKLQEMVDKAEETRMDNKIEEVKPLKQIIYRLEARAQ